MTTRTTHIYDQPLTLTRIDWRLLADAVDFYEKRGFEYVELPYMVPQAVAAMTFDGNGYDVSWGHTLVGSAEQSFLNDAVGRWSAGLAPGLYVGCTPCFRREPVLSEQTQPHFMKVELFDNRPEADAWQLMTLARTFMMSMCDRVLIETTSAGWDLIVDGVEVGSYGLRRGSLGTREVRWAYGTGLALPRFSQARRRR